MFWTSIHLFVFFILLCIEDYILLGRISLVSWYLILYHNEIVVSYHKKQKRNTNFHLFLVYRTHSGKMFMVVMEQKKIRSLVQDNGKLWSCC